MMPAPVNGSAEGDGCAVVPRPPPPVTGAAFELPRVAAATAPLDTAALDTAPLATAALVDEVVVLVLCVVVVLPLCVAVPAVVPLVDAGGQLSQNTLCFAPPGALSASTETLTCQPCLACGLPTRPSWSAV